MVTTKDELFSELLALRTEISSHLADMDASDDLTEGGTGYTNHPADDGTAVHDQQINHSTYQAAQDRLREVEDALARYEAGTYGICENCGQEIDIARLEAIPYTRVCLRCAEQREYHAGMAQ
ncbi:MAG: TraR/DksA C4-type zinc finger protein [Chloroflexota bacterium]|jgi:RNA polymerase-binding transcription factor DksA|nr:TraR/DksA C4-type zinc finger protein [Aggregatilineaceae bacterium]